MNDYSTAAEHDLYSDPPEPSIPELVTAWWRGRYTHAFAIVRGRVLDVKLMRETRDGIPISYWAVWTDGRRVNERYETRIGAMRAAVDAPTGRPSLALDLGEEVCEAIATAAESGLTAKQVAARFGLTENQVRRLAQERGFGFLRGRALRAVNDRPAEAANEEPSR